MLMNYFRVGPGPESQRPRPLERDASLPISSLREPNIAADTTTMHQFLQLTKFFAFWLSNHSVPALTRGCISAGFTFDESGHAWRTLDSGRRYYVHKSYEPTAQHSVVLSFHGYGESPKEQETLSQFSDPGLKVAGHGIIAAYPEGALGTKTHKGIIERKPAWLGAPCANKTVDDVSYVPGGYGGLAEPVLIRSNSSRILSLICLRIYAFIPLGSTLPGNPTEEGSSTF
jgi:hypothetical protein